MFSVIVKNTDYKEYSTKLSLANAMLAAEDAIIHIVGYLEGHGHNREIFLKEHPSSTIGTPEYYCIPGTDTFKIYRHQKINYYFSSYHKYEKIYTVKIVKISDKAIGTYDCVYHHRNSDWNIIFDEVLMELTREDESSSFFGSSIDSSAD